MSKDKEHTVVNFSPEFKVLRHHQLAKAIFQLSLPQYRLYCFLVSQIKNKEWESFRTITFKATDYLRFIHETINEGPFKPHGEMYARLKEDLDALAKTDACYETETHAYFGTVGMGYYEKHTGLIKFLFNEGLAQYLLSVKKCYIAPKLKLIFNLKTIAQVRMYEYLRCYGVGMTPIMDYPDFLEMLNMAPNTKYTVNEKRTFLPMQEVLNEHTDRTFEIEPIRTGRQVTQVKLKVLSGSVKDKKEAKIDNLAIYLKTQFKRLSKSDIYRLTKIQEKIVTKSKGKVSEERFLEVFQEQCSTEADIDNFIDEFYGLAGCNRFIDNYA